MAPRTLIGGYGYDYGYSYGGSSWTMATTTLSRGETAHTDTTLAVSPAVDVTAELSTTLPGP